MAEITREDVAHLGNLARIKLGEDEIAELTDQLGAILSAVARVQEVATADVPGTSHPLPLLNVTRPDVVRQSLTNEQALSGAPDSDQERFKVPQILGEEA
ncbi:MAG TPA: Asp-tRNA(Asn)/Glu-tRNA(Gln) amidotransferase subunit GatC [Candidatus Nanopelagicaceae bacterium]|nr:Asp-tRNA(Asn)/Glu-tRNA(Gln) amidotransferase subunit GatC [Candidatus Nanopelagicaceae bacterium]